MRCRATIYLAVAILNLTVLTGQTADFSSFGLWLSVARYEDAQRVARQQMALRPYTQWLTLLMQAHENYNESIEKAHQLYHNNTSLHNAENTLFYHLLMGDIHRYHNNCITASEHYEKVIQIAPQVKSFDFRPARASKNLANCYYASNQYAKSLIYFKEALSLYAQLDPRNIQVGHITFNIGTVHLDMNQFDSAHVYLNRAREHYRLYAPKPEIEEADVFINFGKMARLSGQYAQALGHYEKAIAICRKYPKELQSNIVKAIMNRGVVYEDMGHYQRALDSYLNALKISDKQHSLILTLYINIGNLLMAQNRIQEADTYIDKAVKIVQTPLVDNAQRTIFNGEPHDGMLALALKGWMEAKKNPGLAGKLKAHHYFKQVLKLYSESKLYNEVDGLDFRIVQMQELPEQIIEVYNQLYQQTSKIQYLQEALDWMTLLTNAHLSKRINEGQLARRYGVPDSIIVAGHNYRAQINNFYIDLISQGENQQAVREKLISTEMAYNAFLENVKKKYPTYFIKRHQQQTLTINQLRNSLLTGRSFVQFFVGSNYVYRIFINRQHIRLDRVGSTADCRKLADSLIRSTYRLTSDSSIPQIQRTAYDLYRILFGSIDHLLTHQTTICPHNFLCYVPFAALVTKEPTTSVIVNWLCERTALSQVYAPQQLTQHGTTPTAKHRTLLVITPDYKPQDKQYLPYLKAEADRILQICSGILLNGPAACVHNAVQPLQLHQLVHLCGHAVVDHQVPLDSYIELGSCDNEQYSRLHLRDLYELSSVADLVSISTCDSGNGFHLNGEGVLSMAHGFAHTGARNLLTNIWQLSDLAAYELFPTFYRLLMKYSCEDKALQASQTEWIRAHSGYQQHPFYWAGLTLYGPCSPRVGSVFKIIGSLLALITLGGILNIARHFLG